MYNSNLTSKLGSETLRAKFSKFELVKWGYEVHVLWYNIKNNKHINIHELNL